METDTLDTDEQMHEYEEYEKELAEIDAEKYLDIIRENYYV